MDISVVTQHVFVRKQSEKDAPVAGTIVPWFTKFGRRPSQTECTYGSNESRPPSRESYSMLEQLGAVWRSPLLAKIYTGAECDGFLTR